MTGTDLELMKLGVALLIFVAGGLGWWIRRSVERKNATRALLIEIEQINVAIQKRFVWWTKFGKKDVDAGMSPEPLSDFFAPAYDHLADKLHLLEPKVARKVVKIHATGSSSTPSTECGPGLSARVASRASTRNTRMH